MVLLSHFVIIKFDGLCVSVGFDAKGGIEVIRLVILEVRAKGSEQSILIVQERGLHA